MTTKVGTSTLRAFERRAYVNTEKLGIGGTMMTPRVHRVTMASTSSGLSTRRFGTPSVVSTPHRRLERVLWPSTRTWGLSSALGCGGTRFLRWVAARGRRRRGWRWRTDRLLVTMLLFATCRFLSCSRPRPFLREIDGGAAVPAHARADCVDAHAFPPAGSRRGQCLCQSRLQDVRRTAGRLSIPGSVAVSAKNASFCPKFRQFRARRRRPSTRSRPHRTTQPAGGFSSSSNVAPCANTVMFPEDSEITSASESVFAVMAAAATCRAPRPRRT